MKKNQRIVTTFFATACLLTSFFSGNASHAAIDISKIPDVLYEGSILTFKAKPKTLLNTAENPFSVILITADNQEIVLESFVNSKNTAAQAVLPLLPEKSANLFRIILKTYGADVDSSNSEGVTRLLARKPSTLSTNLVSEKPITPLLDLNSAPILPDNTDPGLVLTGPQGPTGPTGATGVGAQGPIGLTGATGPQGPIGLTGANGSSAYQVAVASGFVGTESQWLLSLKGADGAQGATGAIGPQGLTGAQGPIGLTGATGPQGPIGLTGANGSSAYQVALANGFVGTESQWLLSLKGADGAQGATGSAGATGAQGPAGPVGARGPVGPAGPQGIQGPSGLSGGYIIGVVNHCPDLDAASFSVHLANISGEVNLSSTNRNFRFNNVPSGTYTLILKQFGVVAGSLTNISVTDGATTDAGYIPIVDCDYVSVI